MFFRRHAIMICWRCHAVRTCKKQVYEQKHWYVSNRSWKKLLDIYKSANALERRLWNVKMMVTNKNVKTVYLLLYHHFDLLCLNICFPVVLKVWQSSQEGKKNKICNIFLMQLIIWNKALHNGFSRDCNYSCRRLQR